MMTLRAVVLKAVSATGDDIRLSDTKLPLHSAMACVNMMWNHRHTNITTRYRRRLSGQHCFSGWLFWL